MPAYPLASPPPLLVKVEYMPAYLNKRLNNRLWTRRKQAQQQQQQQQGQGQRAVAAGSGGMGGGVGPLGGSGGRGT